MKDGKGGRRDAVDRRGFLSAVGAGGALVGASTLTGVPLARAAKPEDWPLGGGRAERAFAIRRNAARAYTVRPDQPARVGNGDEERYFDLRASFFKCLPQNDYGEVDRSAWQVLVSALASGRFDALEAVPRSPLAERRLANPLAAYAYEMIGPDAWYASMPPAPLFSGARQAAEMGEVYWQALTRDVPFRHYRSEPLIAEAVRDLNAFTSVPGAGAGVSAANVFRGETQGDLRGPYLSQFLWLPAQWGPARLVQRYLMPQPAQDFGVARDEWLSIQRGAAPVASAVSGATPRYIATGRDLAEYVHGDVVYQGYLTAALIALGYGSDALDPANPYRDASGQAGFVTFGAAEIVDLVASAALSALKAAWSHKWLVHRRLRPEVLAARAHFQAVEGRHYDLHEELFDSRAVARMLSTFGGLFLPLAYPEGSPTHPSYPAGHAAVAGACVTVLKAVFDESFVVPEPVEASADGSRLDEWTGEALTLGGEFDKLASNITLGRDAAGVHYRSDGIEGLFLGEQVGLGVLRDYARTRPERFGGYTLRRFNGEVVQVGG